MECPLATEKIRYILGRLGLPTVGDREQLLHELISFPLPNTTKLLWDSLNTSDVVGILSAIQEGADINSVDRFWNTGLTPFIMFLKQRDKYNPDDKIEIFNALMEHGVDVNKSVTDFSGRERHMLSPLYVLATGHGTYNNNPPFIESLLANGADAEVVI